MDAIVDAVAARVLARQCDGFGVLVDRPDLDLRVPGGERDADHAAAAPDVGNLLRVAADQLVRGAYEPLGRGTRREHASGREREREIAERGFHGP